MRHMHILLRTQRQKLDPKARKCILMGYGVETKGYDPERKNIFHSRDVEFNELEFRRSQVIKTYNGMFNWRQLSFYGEWANLSDIKEPCTFREAQGSPQKTKWMTAMKEEMKYLQEKNVWDLVTLPADRKNKKPSKCCIIHSRGRVHGTWHRSHVDEAAYYSPQQCSIKGHNCL